MATAVKQEDIDNEDRKSVDDADEALKARLARKRTKTGCLTCRRRRIKCGEERPICKNCVKSKRHCEGYTPRVTFRPPSFDFRPVANGAAQITFQASPPTEVYPPQHYPDAYQSHQAQHQQRSHHQYPFIHGQVPMYVPAAAPEQIHYPVGYPVQHPARNDSFHQQPQSIAQAQGWMQVDPAAPHPVNRSHVDQADPQHPWPAYSSGVIPQPVSSTAPLAGQEAVWMSPTYVPRPELMQPIDYQPPTQRLVHYDPAEPQALNGGGAFGMYGPYDEDRKPAILQGMSPTQMLSEAAVEKQDDDYWDVDSGDEAGVDTRSPATTVTDRNRAFGRILALNQATVRDAQLRQHGASVFDGVLDHYRAEQTANPLRNPVTARVFAHFVSTTGPSLSVFERHPPDTGGFFPNGTVPLSQQGLWTYAMPMLALRHQGLLHAILAISSLHIARLQNASTTPSLQHYAWALKRVHHCVGHPKKRLQPATIAASMLLGFYEIMGAEHNKWNSHLSGAKQLIAETNYRGMAAQVRRMKAEKASRVGLGRRQRRGSESPMEQDAQLDEILDVDERLISYLAGHEVGLAGHEPSGGASIPPSLDLSKYETLRDLHWWYCKQDCFQSLVSGNPLLMHYSKWGNCPPRAPLGIVDAVHGSYDHLILLLGRIATFSAKDRARKLKQMEANGGQWRPAPGMKIPRPPASPGSKAPPTPPTYFGMAPPQPTRTHTMYKSTQDFESPQSTRSYDPIDLHEATEAAMEEYGRIRSALHTFSSNLGEAFEPLTSDYAPPSQTPFGTALFYRSYDIASVWQLYNMAVIIAIRSHPHMPPAAHMAAAVAAHETTFFANEIGRIASCIQPPPPHEPLNPVLAAALNDSCMSSFFAAIQYQDPEQRRVTVERIVALSARTGWGSGEVIANGCETAWVKAAEAGRGPPYRRVIRRKFSDDPRLAGIKEEVDWKQPAREGDDYDRRHIASSAASRIVWAVGILGMEEDMARIGIEE
ncbi:hypothetical protein K431DRAFT_280682 [Polychaeton citri CBS 116435]|uniref:Zn(2)-C6 fungal-type domain-containing protein n=1 Tax=Polychaeton citri CBS 116435 TaxID=1314669 RepID=A0A9P4UVA0_9PEZI|nr:hypothetical protein K431DRAFT_280682 [Polychaeton citri CBS 116435]